MISLFSQLRQYGLSFVSILLVGLGVVVYVYRYYRSLNTTAPGNSWTDKWVVSPESLGGFSYSQLALASVVGLFLELLMIRWVSSEIRMFAYFKNFVLIACFLGFGLGCYLCRRRINLFMMALPLVALTVLITIPWTPFRELVGHLPSFLGVFSEMNFWSVGRYSFGAYTVVGVLAAITVVVLVFALIAFVFIPVGQFVGWYLENARKGIFGYTINILGSLAGILLYTLLCFLYLPPAVWLLFAGIMFVWLVWRVRWVRFATAVAFLLCLALAALRTEKNATIYWSPYQELSVAPVVRKTARPSPSTSQTNGDWYQKIFNLSGAVCCHPFRPLQRRESRLECLQSCPTTFALTLTPSWFSALAPETTLPLLLRNGANRVVAVEIDPLILRLGKKSPLRTALQL